jgi:hypothetical protein
VFRYTDHIGRTVFVPDSDHVAAAAELVVTDAPRDGYIPDPAIGSTTVAGHDDYWPAAEARTLVRVWSPAPEEAAV